jgi:serine/threonine-protein kinase
MRKIAFVSTAAAMLILFAAFAYWLSQRSQTRTVTPDKVNSDSNPEVEIPPPPPGMNLIPAGSFTMGNNASEEKIEQGEHEVTLPAFYLDIHEVTNRQYYDFLQSIQDPDERKRRTPWAGERYPAGKDNHPVVNVSWEDAQAYAKWAGKRLPTEQEWEYAARGKDKWLYAWGNECNAGCPEEYANSNEAGISGTAPVGSFPKGRTWQGIMDMTGNVAEWTDSDYNPYPNTPDPRPLNGKVVRGCSFRCSKEGLVVTARFTLPKNARRTDTGFRCAKSVAAQ